MVSKCKSFDFWNKYPKPEDKSLNLISERGANPRELDTHKYKSGNLPIRFKRWKFHITHDRK